MHQNSNIEQISELIQPLLILFPLTETLHFKIEWTKFKFAAIDLSKDISLFPSQNFFLKEFFNIIKIDNLNKDSLKFIVILDLLTETLIGSSKLRANYAFYSLTSISHLKVDPFWTRFKNVLDYLFKNLDFSMSVLFLPLKQMLSKWSSINLYDALRLLNIMIKILQNIVFDYQKLIHQLVLLGLFSNDQNMRKIVIKGIKLVVKMNSCSNAFLQKI
jgi:hypothetical protein